MGKILAGVALGVFAGAMVAEMLRRTNPRWLRKVGARLRQSARAAKEAFMEGYAGTKKAPETETA